MQSLINEGLIDANDNDGSEIDKNDVLFRFARLLKKPCLVVLTEIFFDNNSNTSNANYCFLMIKFSIKAKMQNDGKLEFSIQTVFKR